jgi:hypothetical protein
MRAVLAMLLLSSLAHAQFDPCKRYADQEEQTAHENCVAEWRMLLPRAEEELRMPPPERVGNCGKHYAAWEAAAHTDLTNPDAMSHRISTRETVEDCNRRWRFEHAPQAEKTRREAPGMIRAGGVLLVIGGVGLTAVGGAGIGTQAYDGLGAVIMGSMGAFTGAIAIVGAVLLGVGAKYRR